MPGLLERYAKAKDRARSMMAHIHDQPHYWPEHDKLSSCSNRLLYRYYYVQDDMRLAEVMSCHKHLLCPMCAIFRGARTLRNYLERFQVLQGENPQLRAYLVTFTVKNGPDLSERFDHLAECLRRLHTRRRKYLSGKSKRAPYTEATKALGAVWSFEVTNNGNGWHPHCHSIWLCESRPDVNQLQSEWQRITGDSFIVDVRKMYGEPVKSFAEVFKYSLKFSTLDLDSNLHAYEVLCPTKPGRGRVGKRLLGSFGLFRGVPIGEAGPEEQLDDPACIEMLYRFVGGPEGGEYRLVETIDDDTEASETDAYQIETDELTTYL